MEAENRNSADEMLVMLKERSGVNMQFSMLEDIRIESPLKGVSTKKKKGKDYIWVGKDLSPDGWILKSDFENNKKRNDEQF